MQRRKALLAAHDALAILATACVLVAGFPSVALAYVDPSVMTYTIQALAGVAVALSAVLGVAFRRSRRALMRLLHIDENSGKYVEGDVHPIDPSEPGAAELLAAADDAARQHRNDSGPSPQTRTLNWSQRLIRSVVASLFTIGTLFVLPPLEIVGGTTSGLLFDLFAIVPLVTAFGVALAVLCALGLALLRGRAFDIGIGVMVAIGLGAYLQAMLMNAMLPVADGTSLDLSQFASITVISTIVWIAIIAAALWVALKHVRVERAATMVIAVGLVIVQGVGAASLIAHHTPSEDQRRATVTATREGLYTLSKSDNVVVFVLDTYDARYLNEVLEENPAALDEFSGFTYFRNATPSMVPTRYGIPFLLTGRAPDGTQTFTDFTQTWFEKSHFLSDIQNAGYTLGVYSDSMGTDVVNAEPYVMNIHERRASSMDPGQMLEVLIRVSLYRDMPWALKPWFWFTTDDLNRAFSSGGPEEERPYTVDDAHFFEGLQGQGLSLNNEGKSFRFIHLLGPHKPYTLDANGNTPGGETSLTEQAQGTLKIVDEYLRQMKELGIYDNATILVTADHGNWQLSPEGITEPTSVIMLVKPAENSEEAAQPLQTSDVPTGHLDYAATVIDAVGGDGSSYGTPIFEVTDGARPRFYWSTTTDYHEDMDWTQDEIDGDVLDWNDWKATGTVIEIPNKNRPLDE